MAIAMVICSYGGESGPESESGLWVLPLEWACWRHYAISRMISN